MKLYKTGDLVEYKIPIFTCVKCNKSQVFDPAMILNKNLIENNFVPSVVEKCSCGSDEFTYSEFLGTVGIGANSVKLK